MNFDYKRLWFLEKNSKKIEILLCESHNHLRRRVKIGDPFPFVMEGRHRERNKHGGKYNIL